MCSLILRLTALDNLFNLLLVLVGILFTVSIAWHQHHHLSLIVGMGLAVPRRPQA